MAKAIRFHSPGSADVLRYEDVEIANPGDGEILLRHTAIGINYIDIYHRTGLYPVPLPGGLGSEACGVVEAVGHKVDGFSVGDRVAYAGGTPGSYSEMRIIAADLAVKVPAEIEDQQAAALLLKGMTVEFLTMRCAPVAGGDIVLLHAAAGGVGLIACQWLSSRGVVVIGTVSSRRKADIARANGCAHVINYNSENVIDRVREITGGSGVKVVYDSVGKDTWSISIECLARRGLLVSFGNTTGAVAPVRLSELAMKGSLYVTRPVLGDYIASRDERDASAAKVFAAIMDGTLKANIQQTYPLANAAEAHTKLETGQTIGTGILLP